MLYLYITLTIIVENIYFIKYMIYFCFIFYKKIYIIIYPITCIHTCPYMCKFIYGAYAFGSATYTMDFRG